MFDFREPVSAWSHGLWMLLAVPGTVLLWRRGRGDRGKQLSLLVFGLCLVYCFAGSLLFHAVRPPRLVRYCRLLDHVGIYLLIAGSYTPAAVVVLRGAWRWGTLILSWLLAFGGIAVRLSAGDLPPGFSTGYYLVMGWGAILCYFELARVLSRRALRPVVLGGVLYSVGALVNLAHWPEPIPDVLGAHEVFHFFVMAASLAHFYFMLRFVAPFERGPAAESALAADGEAYYPVPG